jgi:sialate O-acetylesterase
MKEYKLVDVREIDRMKTVSTLTALLFAAVSASADVTLNAIIDEHMVLQRDIPVAVYGKAEPGGKVTVAFAGQTQSASADKEGAWCVKLSSPTPSRPRKPSA